MSARTKARKRALDLLYSADQRGMTLPDMLVEESKRAESEPARQASWLYAREIVSGVQEHWDAITELIETYAHGWTIERMPAIDRALARIGVWELVYNEEIPAAVAISEAVEAAQMYSTDDSAAFLNGLLGRIAAVNP